MGWYLCKIIQISDDSGDDDGDGVPDHLDDDDDNDGIPDHLDVDDDGDGIPDADEGQHFFQDAIHWYLGWYLCNMIEILNPEGNDDGEGVPDCLDNDGDNGGIPDYLDVEDDGDGIPKEQQTA